MGQREKYTRREIERSFRKFRDIANDLSLAKFQTWGDSFTRLISHCESDSVMQVVISPLKTNPCIDANKWWNDALNSVGGMIGSGHYALPADDDECTSLLYQLFLKIEFENLSLEQFCLAVYGTTNYQDMVNTFNRELVQKFTREVSYRLDEIMTDTIDQTEIPRKAMIVFHHYDYSTTISGSVQGSNIATGNAQITKASVQYNTLSDVATELRALKSLVSQYSKTNQATISQSLDFLASITETDNADIANVVEHIQTVAEVSPTIRHRLYNILLGTGTSLLGSVIMEGLKVYFSG